MSLNIRKIQIGALLIEGENLQDMISERGEECAILADLLAHADNYAVTNPRPATRAATTVDNGDDSASEEEEILADEYREATGKRFRNTSKVSRLEALQEWKAAQTPSAPPADDVAGTPEDGKEVEPSF